jgi:mannose-6-phosphate isomerase-like protein (cupin superfamily)
MELIEKLNYTGENYQPVYINEKWQVAYLNSCPECRLESIKKMDIHYNTDEVFILLEGRAILIAAEISGDKISFGLIDMKQGATYNIPKKTWHNIVLFEDTRVYIVEDANTHLEDYEFYYLSEEQTQQLRNKMKLLE